MRQSLPHLLIVLGLCNFPLLFFYYLLQLFLLSPFVSIQIFIWPIWLEWGRKWSWSGVGLTPCPKWLSGYLGNGWWAGSGWQGGSCWQVGSDWQLGRNRQVRAGCGHDVSWPRGCCIWGCKSSHVQFPILPTLLESPTLLILLAKLYSPSWG